MRLVMSPANADIAGYALENVRSYLFKARALRGIAETLKTAGGLGEATTAVGQAALNIDRGKWSAEVGNDTYTFTSTAREIILGATVTPASDVIYSLAVNLVRANYTPSLSGFRSSALYDIGVSEADNEADPWFDSTYTQYTASAVAATIAGAWVPEKTTRPNPDDRRRLGKINAAGMHAFRPFIHAASRAVLDQDDSINVFRIHSGFTNRLAEIAGWGREGRVQREATRSGLFGWELIPFHRVWDQQQDVLEPLGDTI